MQEYYVDSVEQLSSLCRDLQDSEWLAIDTEFIREQTYFPEFCLLQIANDKVCACVDPLAIEDLSELFELLYSTDVTKVFHAAKQDLEIFFHRWQRIPKPLFDTQIGAALFGLGDQPGYAATVETMLGVKVDKNQVRTNWKRRPLADSQIRYALNDVVYLGQLYQKMHQDLVKLGRQDWMAEDFERLADPANYAILPDSRWLRIRGKNKLRGKQLAVLKALASWRETQAIDSNKPRRWIIGDDTLLQLAKKMPTELTAFKLIKGLQKNVATHFGEDIVAIIREAAATPSTNWPPSPDSATARLSCEEDALVDLLQCALKLRAHQENLSPASIVARKELEKLARGDRSTLLSRGWRFHFVGEALLRLLDGKIGAKVISGKVKLIDANAN